MVQDKTFTGNSPAAARRTDVNISPADSTTKSDSELIEELRNCESFAPSDAGEDWCAIDSKWLSQAKKYLEEGSTNEADHPGPINNSGIFDKVDGMNYLKEDTGEKGDYELITRSLWNKLVTKFGTDAEPQIIPLRTYLSSDGSVKIETKPLKMECVVYPTSPLVRKNLRISRGFTLEESYGSLLRTLGISAPEPNSYRLWILSPEGKFDMPELNMDKYISELDLGPEHTVILEKVVGKAQPLSVEKNRNDLRANLRPTATVTIEDNITNGRRSPYFLRNADREEDADKSLSESIKQQSLVGLGNLGNTCFMNSSLQCLSHIPELTNYFLTKDYTADINVDNVMGKKGEIANIYADLIRQLWTKSGSVYPSRFRTTLARHSSLFNGSQQDSQECLQFIVDCLHEDLNRVKKRIYKEQQSEDESKTDEENSKASWDYHNARGNSVVSDLFCGQIRSEVCCPDCNKKSITFDPVYYYSLPLPSNQLVKITTYFMEFNGESKPKKIKVSVQKTGTVRDFLGKVSEQVTVKSDNLMAVDCYNQAINKFLDLNTPVEDITSRCKVLVYEKPDSLSDGEMQTAFVYVRKTTKSILSSSPSVVDFPLMISISKNGLKAKALYRTVYNKLLPNLHVPEPSDVLANNAGDGDENNAVNNKENGEEMDVDDMDATGDENVSENDTNSPFPSMFNLTLVNQAGNHEIEKIPIGLKKSLVFKSSPVFIAVDFPGELCDKYYEKNVLEFDAAETGRFGWMEQRKGEPVDLMDCFNLFITPEKLTGTNLWRCPVCKDEKAAFKKLDFWRMPKYMFVHLKRFQYNRFYRDKLATAVKFPSKDLDITGLVKNQAEHPVLYDLVAISCHSGGLGGGHYWAICLNSKNGKWYKFDDQSVNEVNDPAGNEHDNTPYILVYRRQRDSEMQEDEEVEMTEQPLSGPEEKMAE